MTAPTVTRTPATQRSIVVDNVTWNGLRAYFAGLGIQVSQIPCAAGQMPQYRVTGITTPGPRLAHREMQVLFGMSRGKTNVEIGAELYLAKDTIKTTAKRLFKKLGVRDRAHAVALGYQLGILGGVA
jgi:DNA-binding CsgD family transcriptional regulator